MAKDNARYEKGWETIKRIYGDVSIISQENLTQL